MKGIYKKIKEDKLSELSEMLKALAHPARLRIVACLLDNECNVASIQNEMVLPQSTVSQHLAILRKQKILKAERQGTQVCYRVVDPRVPEIIKMIAEER